MSAQIFAGLTAIQRNAFLNHHESSVKTPFDLLNRSSLYFEISVEHLVSSHRMREYVVARHMIIYAIRDFFPEFTLKSIGKMFNRHHSSVIHAIQSVSDLKSIDKKFEAELSIYMQRL